MNGYQFFSVAITVFLSCSECLLQNKFPETGFGVPGNWGENPGRNNRMYSYHRPHLDSGPEPPDLQYPVQHAGLPQGLAVYPLPLEDSYHELKFNVSWQHSFGPPARDYSIEIRSVTETVDCQTPMCYEYNIPGEASWWPVPAYPNPVVETCAVRPGCAYRVRLIAHPWDGHTSANLLVELDECVAGVCSCAHAPRLPVPKVKAQTVSIQGEIFVNVSWTTPKPTYPQRLPPGLKKQRYAVSIGKQMVSNAHPSPWFANTVIRYVDADGPVAHSDTTRWLLLPVSERSSKRSDERSDKRMIKQRNLVLDVRLLARVSLIDDRGCKGPEGNATAYDPLESNKKMFGTYVLWASFGGACVVAAGAFVAASARVVKRILNAFRPAPVSAPLEAMHRRPAWFPLQLRTSVEECQPQPSQRGATREPSGRCDNAILLHLRADVFSCCHND